MKQDRDNRKKEQGREKPVRLTDVIAYFLKGAFAHNAGGAQGD